MKTTGLFIVACYLAIATAMAQEFRPYPNQRVTAEQWQAYFDEVKKKLGATASERGRDHMVVFRDDTTKTEYDFTTPGNPAHPAWVTVRLIPRNGPPRTDRVGYYAGDAEAFDKLFRGYEQLDASLRKATISQLEAAVPPDARIETSHLPGGGYKLTLTVPGVTEVPQGQLMLMAAALRACEPLEFEFGKYQFQTTEKLDPSATGKPERTLVLRQDIACVPDMDVAAATPMPAVSAGPQPTAAQTEALRKLTVDYLAAKDSGNYDRAYAFLSPTMQALSPWETWRKNAVAFNKMAGVATNRTVANVRWYENPPNADGPGIYATADFVSRFTQLAVDCGYVAWKQQPDGSMLIIREEDNFITRKDAERSTDPGLLESMKKKFNCVLSYATD